MPLLMKICLLLFLLWPVVFHPTGAEAIITLREDLELEGFAQSQFVLRTPQYQGAQLAVQRNTLQLENTWHFIQDAQTTIGNLPTGLIEDATFKLIYRFAYDSTYDLSDSRRDHFSKGRRVRRFPQPRRQDRFPNQPITYDDFLGRDAWEFTWRIIGTDILYETVRFPTTRQSITLLNPDGSFSDVAASDLKLMGDDYPAYTPDGGVSTYLLEATAKTDWLPNYYAPRILYWVDQRSFYPLRTEQYGPDGELVAIEARLVKLFNPKLKERGYHNLITVWWNAQLDFLAYAVHDGQQLRQWSAQDLAAFFTPDFMRREWFPVPMKTQATAQAPEEFFLRPHLYPEKFPEERNVVLPPDLTARIQAQNVAGHVVFTVSSPDETS